MRLAIDTDKTIHEAAASGDIEAIKILLIRGEDINDNSEWVRFSDGSTANLECDGYEGCSKGYLTPLHLAAYNGHYQLVEYLLQRAVDPFIEFHAFAPKKEEIGLFSWGREEISKKGNVVQLAYYNSYDKVVKLLETKMNYTLPKDQAKTCTQPYLGRLGLGAAKLPTDQLNKLIELLSLTPGSKGAPSQKQIEISFINSIECQMEEAVKEFIKSGKVNLNNVFTLERGSSTFSDYTTLHLRLINIVSCYGNWYELPKRVQILNILLQNGAQIELCSDLNEVVYYLNVEKIRTLQAYNPNKLNKLSYGVFLAAAFSYNYDVISYLMDNGFNPFIKLPEHISPAIKHLLAEGVNPSILKLIFEKKPQLILDIKSGDNKESFENIVWNLSSKNGLENLKLLFEHGIRLNNLNCFSVVQKWDCKMFKYLIEQQVPIDFNKLLSYAIPEAIDMRVAKIGALCIEKGAELTCPIDEKKFRILKHINFQRLTRENAQTILFSIQDLLEHKTEYHWINKKNEQLLFSMQDKLLSVLTSDLLIGTLEKMLDKNNKDYDLYCHAILVNHPLAANIGNIIELYNEEEICLKRNLVSSLNELNDQIEKEKAILDKYGTKPKKLTAGQVFVVDRLNNSLVNGICEARGESSLALLSEKNFIRNIDKLSDVRDFPVQEKIRSIKSAKNWTDNFKPDAKSYLDLVTTPNESTKEFKAI